MIPLNQLRARSLKQRTSAELLVDRWFARRVSIYLTWLLVHLPLTANQVTVASFVAMLAGAVCLALPGRAPLAGAGLLLIGYVLDCCDGEIARFRGQTSLRGMYLDTLAHAATIPAIFAAAGIGQLVRHGTVEALAFGTLAAIASTNPARAALVAVHCNTPASGSKPPAPAPDHVHPAACRCPLKGLYLRTMGRLAIFPNSMFVLAAAAAADDILLREAHRGIMFWALAAYAALLCTEQAAAAVAWSHEDRLAQGER